MKKVERVKRGRISAVVILATTALLVVGAGSGLAGSGTVTDGATATTGLDTDSALVQLNGDPLSKRELARAVYTKLKNEPLVTEEQHWRSRPCSTQSI